MPFKPRVLTLRRAIVLTVVLGLLAPALLINGYSWFRQYNDGIRQQTDELLLQTAVILSKGMQEPLWNLNPESGQALLDAVMSGNDDIVHIEVRDNTLGIFVSDERPERRDGYTAITEKPITYRDSTIGSVKIEIGSMRLRSVMAGNLFESFIAVLAQAALSITLILALLERRLAGPLQRLRAGAERLAKRELDKPFTWMRLDEIGMLSQRMEETRLSLRKLFDELDSKNKELEQDIEKRKRIEQELHEGQERFRALVEQSPIAIIEWNNKHCVIEWNAAAERIFGYKREYALGRHASFIIPNATRESVDITFKELSAEDVDNRSISKNRTFDGRIITCQWSHTRIADETTKSDRLLSIAEDITEKRCAEEALSLSEAKFAGAFQGNPDSIAICRMGDGTIIDVNQTFEDLTGYRREEVLSKTAIALEIWVNSEQRRTLIQELNVNRAVRNFEWDMRTKFGTVRKCMTNATIFTVGADDYMLAVVRDITDQRLLEEQKAEADRALLRLAQGTRDIAGESFFELLVADLASALRINGAFIGLRVPEAQGNILTLAAHINGKPVDNFRYDSAGTPCERVLDGHISLFPSGIHASCPDVVAFGKHDWESYAGAPLRDVAGNTIGVLAVLHSSPLGNTDLIKSLLQVFSERASAELERKRAEEELRNSERRFSSIFQSSPIAMFVIQAKGKFIVKDVNRAFEHLFQRGRETVLGKNTMDLGLYCDPEDRKSLIHEITMMEATQSHREVWMWRGDDSKVLVQFSGHAFSLAGERFGIMACADITDKRRIENEIRELNANLEQRVTERTEELQRANEELATTLETLHRAQEDLVRSEKLAALGELVAGIAHELNTPIGNSLMVASTLADQTRALATSYEHHGLKRSELERFIGDADKASDILTRNLQRAADMVTSFKQVAVDQTSSQRRKFSLAEVVSEIMLTLWPTLKKTSFIVQQEIPHELTMDSYPGPLGQVVANLVNNALLHGFEGRHTGTVSIMAETSGDGWLELTVKDDGIGIPRAALNRIFDPFYTTKLGAGGSGLGLNITHNIVTGILGGRIRVNSEPGKGSAFILSLPMEAPHIHAEGEVLHDLPSLM